ncbi:hypothetical protein QBC42DRAFT_31994 [Cladorrhinum samala]|uniref:DUF6594 domain-containing protein n=1 Tax=Cladorrhinum samala TaxID=585594 RepID=A0AAV9HDI7_9PEZI|nr:hypothetical protein QBC42DRAFT_31994 [Cladorrhinum samala]
MQATMAGISIDEIDLAERGQVEEPESGMGPTTRSSKTPTGTSQAHTEVPFQEEREAATGNMEDINTASGQAGCARRKQLSREWLFFPACEVEFCLVMEYWCYRARRTREAIEELERRNKELGREDYKHHLPDNEYGREREKLMNQLTMELEKYRDFFSQGNIIFQQPAPHVRYVNEFRQWAYTRVAHDPIDDECEAENYRVIGKPQSVIEGLIHDMFLASNRAYCRVRSILSTILPIFHLLLLLLLNRGARGSHRHHQPHNPKEGHLKAAVEFTVVNYSTFHFFSHLLVISLAIAFLIMPLLLMYLLNLSTPGAVVLTVVFCLTFCVGSFCFGGRNGGANVNTDHKFLLLFAYTGVMATLLSNLHEGSGGAQGRHNWG